MNFIEQFKRWVGKTEAPSQFLDWAALSLLAAACGNRIYLPYRRGNDDVAVVPNLYILLVGPSGVHKSFAISRVQRVLDKITEGEADGASSKRLNAYSGHITHSGLYDAMRTTRRKRIPGGGTVSIEMPWASQFYLLQDELAQCLGGPEHAELVIRALTGMFYGTPFDDATRTNGRIHLQDYCLNWLAGTNVDWLLKSVSPNTLNAGFFRRTVVVCGDAPADRIPPYSAIRPRDWNSVFPDIVERVAYLLDHEGAIPMTKGAHNVDDKWYMGLENPSTDDHGIASVTGRHDLSLRLGVLLALANNETEITESRLAEAQDKTAEAVKWQAELLPLIKKGEVGAPPERILQFILGREGGGVSHERLARYAYEKCAVDANRLADLLRTWMQAGLIEGTKRNGTSYYRGEA